MNLVGLRVLRGPDWNNGDKDGGDGHLGTIVNIGGLKTAQVLWDNGQECVCRIGEDGHYDLRIFDSGPVGVRHMEHVCSSCSERGIFGMRWQCKQCTDVNLCPICYVTDKHSINHPFIRFDTQQSQGVEIPKRSAGVRSQAVGIFPGATVKRGRDWKWDNQDGGEGKTGEVESIKNNEGTSSVRNVVNVKWSSNGKTNSYRLGGIDGKVDLMFDEQSRGPFYYRDHLPVCEKQMKLNVNQGTSSSGAGRETSSGPDIFKEGDNVYITVSDEDLKKFQEQHGGFTRSMMDCSGKIGEIKGFAQDGDALVEFDGLKFRLFPGVLGKVYEFKKGDIVRILDGEEKVKELQDDHGGYIKEMKHYLGKVGQVQKVDSDGDVHVKFGSNKFMYNRMCCLPAPGEEVYEGSDEDADSDNITLNLSDLNNALMMMVSGLAETMSESISIPTLFAAIVKDDIRLVRRVLSDSPGLVDVLHKGMTPLFIACHQGHLEIVLELLNKGANIDKVDKAGNTPLIASISGKEPAIGKLLLERGADVKIVSNNGRTALHFATYADYKHLVEMIIKRGCDVNLQDSDGDTALHDGIATGSDDAIAVLCKAANLNPGLVNQKGFNALQFASLRNQGFAVDKILDRHKSLVDVKKPDGFTALHIAAVNNHTIPAKFLIEKGNADINSKNLEGHTALILAAVKGRLEFVQLLIEKDADVNAVDGKKCSPLHACCIGASSDGGTHQMLAALMGLSSSNDIGNRIQVARCLIQNGARTDLKNVNGHTPLQCCTDERMKNSLSEFIRQRQGGRSSGSFDSGATSSFSDLFELPCRKCMLRPSTITLIPCSHKCVCRECALQANRCPVCQQFILRRVATGDSESENPECCVQ